MPEEVSAAPLPAPADAGVHTTQKKPPAEEAQALTVVEADRGGVGQYPITEALRTAGDTVRSQGAKVFLQALTLVRETDLNYAKAEKKEADERTEFWRNKYHEENRRSAVLESELRSELRFKRLQHFLLILGGIIAGTGLQSLSGAPSGMGWAMLAVGLLMIIVGLFYPPKSTKDNSPE